MSVPNIFHIVQRVRNTYPGLISSKQAVEALNTIALEAGDGWGLLAKPDGNHGPQPVTDILCSCDWLIHQPSQLGLDVFTNGPDSQGADSGPATAQWGPGDPVNMSRFVPAKAVPVVVLPPPPPPPGEEVDPNDEVLELLRTLVDVSQDILLSNIAQEKKLDDLRMGVVESLQAFGKTVVDALKAGGLGGIFNLIK
jgi:hypothetical protein